MRTTSPRDRDNAGTSSRKADHVRINLEQDVRSRVPGSGFEAYRFVNCALPEIDLDEVSTATTFLGRRLAAPVLISCMTGGTAQAKEINLRLARVAQEQSIAMGLGSARALLEDPSLLDSFDVRSAAPDVLLFANIGAVQLNKGYGPDDCRRLVEMLKADALVLHLNAIQEALQPEGDTCFRGLIDRITDVCKRLDVPVVVKEVGWGIDPDTVHALFEAGAAAVDLAGAGGTSWSEVERHRISEPWRARVAGNFADWGIPTAQALRAARRERTIGLLIASGGIRSGMDVAKALALGADLAGVASPFLHAAAEGYEAASDLAREYVEVLRVTMFGTGVRSISDLQRTKRLVHEKDSL